MQPSSTRGKYSAGVIKRYHQPNSVSAGGQARTNANSTNPARRIPQHYYPGVNTIRAYKPPHHNGYVITAQEAANCGLYKYKATDTYLTRRWYCSDCHFTVNGTVRQARNHDAVRHRLKDSSTGSNALTSNHEETTSQAPAPTIQEPLIQPVQSAEAPEIPIPPAGFFDVPAIRESDYSSLFGESLFYDRAFLDTPETTVSIDQWDELWGSNNGVSDSSSFDFNQTFGSDFDQRTGSFAGSSPSYSNNAALIPQQENTGYGTSSSCTNNSASIQQGDSTGYGTSLSYANSTASVQQGDSAGYGSNPYGLTTQPNGQDNFGTYGDGYREDGYSIHRNLIGPIPPERNGNSAVVDGQPDVNANPETGDDLMSGDNNENRESIYPDPVPYSNNPVFWSPDQRSEN